MRIFYYFLRNAETGEKKQVTTEEYMGEPGELIDFNDLIYIVEDYAEEWEVLDEPEDF